MNTPLLKRPLCATLATALILLSPSLGMASSGVGYNGQSASASISIRVVVLPSVRILGDAHPQELAVTPGQPVQALQKLTISTNVTRGFCLQLQSTQRAEDGWKLQLIDGDGMSVAPSQGGYRVCGNSHGTYSMLLQHEFATTASARMAWPVRTELHTI